MKTIILSLSFLFSSLAFSAECLFSTEEVSSIKFQDFLTGYSLPIAAVFVPGSQNRDQIYIVEQRGLIYQTNFVSGTKQVFLDLRSIVSQSGNEAGLLGMALAPNYPVDKRFYLNYTQSIQGQLHSKIVEYSVNDNLQPILASQRELISVSQPFSNHNGGDLKFGKDNYLYIALGDGGSGGDPHNYSQNKSSLLGKILRIDVNSASLIPTDNPFVSDVDSRKEIFALGLRNVWRFSFDKLTGELWAADVGQNRQEEINIVKKGGNYGWNVVEGDHCYLNSNCDLMKYIKPVYTYNHNLGASVTGGYVYRGQAISGLYGYYIYGDYVSGSIWALKYSGGQVIENKNLMTNTANLRLSSFAEDFNGELYIINHSAGRIQKIVPNNNFLVNSDSSVTNMPAKLSDTGCLNSTDPVIWSDKLVPFEVNFTLWSDGAEKSRYVRVPEGEKLHIKNNGDWYYPLGTVLIKNFAFDLVTNEQTKPSLIETRFLVKKQSGFKGYTYRWNAKQTDAFLLEQQEKTTITARVAGEVKTFDYTFPSQSDCVLCHNSLSEGPLALDTLQTNRFMESATNIHQFDYLKNKMVLESFPSPSLLDKLHNDKKDYKLFSQSYLYVNCASCHNNKGGAGRGDFSFEYTKIFNSNFLCNKLAITHNFNLNDTRLIKPENPTESLLYLRVNTLDVNYRMPPLATSLYDREGLSLVNEWISSIDCN